MKVYKAIPEEYLDESLGRSIDVYTEISDGGQRFVGKTQIPTPQGSMTLPFEIDATDLVYAFEKFDESLAAEIAKLKSEAPSDIVMPNKELII